MKLLVNKVCANCPRKKEADPESVAVSKGEITRTSCIHPCSRLLAGIAMSTGESIDVDDLSIAINAPPSGVKPSTLAHAGVVIDGYPATFVIADDNFETPDGKNSVPYDGTLEELENHVTNH